MSKKEFAFIGLRMFSVYILIQSFIDLSHIVNYYLLPIFYEDLQELVQTNVINMLIHLGPFLIQLVIGILLWFNAEKFSRFFIFQDKVTELQDKPTLTVHQFQVAAISIVGLVFIVHTLPSFFSLAQNWLNLKEIGMDYAADKMKAELVFGFLEKLLRLFLGFVLFFCSRGLVGLLNRIRQI